MSSGAAQPVGASRVVVIGAGFAGLAAVRALQGSPARVTPVDRHIYSTFQPLLYQVATGGLNPGDVAYAVRSFVRRRGASFRHGTLTAVSERQVVLADGSRLDYDYLILAAGVTTNHFGVPGAEEHSIAPYTRRQAIVLRDRLMSALEQLSTRGQDAELTVLIVGGGATGVETAGALAELRNAGVKAGFPEIDPRHVHIVLVEQGPELLAPYHPRLRRYALSQLRRRGVDVRLDTPVRELTSRDVTIGAGGHPVTRPHHLGCRRHRGGSGQGLGSAAGKGWSDPGG